MEKDDKDRLEDLVACLGILKRVLNLCLSQEDVPPASAPQHFLKGRQPLSQDDSGHKAKLKSSSCTSFILRATLICWILVIASFLAWEFFVLWPIICFHAYLVLKLYFIKSYLMLLLAF